MVRRKYLWLFFLCGWMNSFFIDWKMFGVLFMWKNFVFGVMSLLCSWLKNVVMFVVGLCFSLVPWKSLQSYLCDWVNNFEKDSPICLCLVEQLWTQNCYSWTLVFRGWAKNVVVYLERSILFVFESKFFVVSLNFFMVARKTLSFNLEMFEILYPILS